MDWLKKAAANVESKLAQTGIVDKLKPVTQAAGQAAGETSSLFKSIGSSLESSFNEVSREKTEEKQGKEVSMDKVGPPWVTSHLGLKAYESDMRAGILKITEGDDQTVYDRLRERPPDEEYEFDWLEPHSTARAMAALEADPRLAAARTKLVPSKIRENEFWRNYFYKCNMIINSYLKMTNDKKQQSKPQAMGGDGGSRYPDASDNIDQDFEPAEFVSDDTVNRSMENNELQTQVKSELGLSWEEEMAKELEGVEVVDKPASVEAEEDEMEAYAKELGDIQ